jgi:hypothetical protein
MTRPRSRRIHRRSTTVRASTVLLALLSVTAVVVAASGGVAATGTTATTASGAVTGPLPNGTVTDATPNRSFVGGYSVQVANVTYAGAGAVENVTVDLAGGTDGDVSPGAVRTVAVALVNASADATRGYAEASYDAHGTTVAVGPVTGVDRVVVWADVADRVPDGARIDASYRLRNATAERARDTGGVQVARTDDRGYVTGRVLTEQGRPVADATVDLVEVESGAVVRRLESDADGRFGLVPVAPNRTYRVEVRKFGYGPETYSRRAFVEPGETESIPVTAEVRLVADRLRLVAADLGDPSTTADDRTVEERPVLYADGRSNNSATYVAVVENSSTERPGGVGLSVFERRVTLEFVGERSVGDFTDDGRIDRRIVVETTLRGDVDGDDREEAYAPFEVTADAADGSTMYAQAVTETVRGSFVNALGREVVAVGLETGDPAFERGADPVADGRLSVGTPVGPAVGEPGERVRVSTTVTADEGAVEDRRVELRLDRDGDGTLAPAETVANRTVTLAAGATETLTFDLDLPEGAGEYRYGPVATDSGTTATGTVAVDAAPWVRFDDDGDGTVSDAELNVAIRAWSADDLTDADLNAVIRRWVAG